MGRDALLDMYLKDLSAFPVLNSEQECALARRILQGDRAARQEFIQCNLRLVVSVARHYENQGMQLLDVIEEGNIGLMRAVERFDPDLKCRFSTYAVHWIKQGIRRSLLEKVKNIRIPAYMAEYVLRYKKLMREQPHLSDTREMVKRLKLPRENLKLIQRIIRTAQISGANLDAEEVSELSGYFVDEHALSNPETALGSSEDAALLQVRLEQLTRREADILRYRYGLDRFPVLTLEEIGRVFGLTRERVRQIEAKSLGRLRERIQTESVL
jgi:RNA polymerase primary sigma factor